MSKTDKYPRNLYLVTGTLLEGGIFTPVFVSVEFLRFKMKSYKPLDQTYEVWCGKCGRSLKLGEYMRLKFGWPLCCGYIMVTKKGKDSKMSTSDTEILVEDIEDLRDKVEVLLSVERLEYHDMNWLSGNNGKRSEDKQEILLEILYGLSDMGVKLTRE